MVYSPGNELARAIVNIIRSNGVQSYCVVRNFCGSVFLRIGNFLRFAETNFCD